MPELPEVQTFINILNKKLNGLSIEDVEIKNDKFLKNTSIIDFKRKIKGAKIETIFRIGKYIIFQLSNGLYIVSHLRMEGKYFVDQKKQNRKHDYIIYKLSNDQYLSYNDSRQFGTIHLTNDYSNLNEIKKIAIDPLNKNFNFDYFYPLVSKSTKNIKLILLDQTYVSGIGNIYASEILFASNVSPFKKGNDLSKNEIKKIVENSKLILNKAIENNGTTIHTFSFEENKTGNYTKFLNVVGRNGKNCNICKSKIIKVMQSSRGTYYCPRCQK